jgi:hypothetical protein
MCRGKANFVVTGGIEPKARVVREQKSLVADMLACVIFPKNDMKIGRVVSRWGNLQAIVPAASLKAHRQQRPWLCLRYRIPGQCAIDTAGVRRQTCIADAHGCCLSLSTTSHHGNRNFQTAMVHGSMRCDPSRRVSSKAAGSNMPSDGPFFVARSKGYMATYRKSWFSK